MNPMCDPAVVRTAIAAILAVARCVACTIVYPTFPVGPDFRVKVEDRGRPVSGLRVAIDSRNSMVTNEHGIAAFREIRPGSYTLIVGRGPGASTIGTVAVKVGGRSGETVPVQWPATPVMVARSMEGRLYPSDPRYSIQVVDAVSNRSLGRTQTDERGAFHLDGVEPGLYFLNLASGAIPVQIDPEAAMERLDVSLGWTSCGLMYSDQSRCEHGVVRLDRLLGRVVDSTGAVIQNANVALVDANDQVIWQMQSDAQGKFEAEEPIEGSFQLIVKMAGFTPLRNSVQLGAKEGLRGIEVQLGIAGSCSVAR
jgi:hypothetical protein